MDASSSQENSFSLRVDLRQVVYALSSALDLVGDVGAHGKRVGIMAASCGQVLGMSKKECGVLFELGALHDIGVSSTETACHLVHEFEWGGAQEHGEVGYNLLKDFPPLASLALPIRYHHTPWSELLKDNYVDPLIASQANLVFLVDRCDILAAPHYGKNSLLMRTNDIRKCLAEDNSDLFSPHLIDAFMDASRTEAFWLQLRSDSVNNYIHKMLLEQEPYLLDFDELKQLAKIFSGIVDAKSPFTQSHSTGVACLASLLATRMGIEKKRCDMLEIAGLLHDLGKLRVPNEILEKQSGLTIEERAIIKAHSFDTYQILSRIDGFEEIACWAGYHHEEPDGEGYPFHLFAAEQPLEAKILRAADIFQAIIQDRPYRKGFSPQEALTFMQQLTHNGRVDGEVVSVLEADLPTMMQAAQSYQ